MDCKILDIDNLDEIKCNELIVYGAGQYGSFLYSLLELKGLAESIVCFAVTDRSDNSDTFYGKPVECIDRIVDRLKDCIVILALGETAAKEVIGSLQDYTIKKICRVNRQTIEDIRKELIAGYKKLPLQKIQLFYHLMTARVTVATVST